MATKKRVHSKVYKFNVSSVFALALTALFADPKFLDAIGAKGYIAMMIIGALINAGLREFTEDKLTPIVKEKQPRILDPLEEAFRKDAEELEE